ncbi:MAG: CDP-alcohol phosphatidyltransferase family protein [Bacteroidales bacterium]
MMKSKHSALWMIPSGITMMNWCAGVFAMVAASLNMYLEAALFIVAASMFDLFDGLVARLIDARSKIGVELDSLVDVISFGLAPSFLMYRLLLDWGFSTLMLFLVFLPAATAVIRLALFNVRHHAKNHFVGLAAPASALFHAGIILSIYLTNYDWLHIMTASSIFWVLSSVSTAMLMLVPIRMFSLKIDEFSWKGNQFVWIFLAAAVLLTILFQIVALPLVIILYVVLSFVHHFINAHDKPYEL